MSSVIIPKIVILLQTGGTAALFDKVHDMYEFAFFLTLSHVSYVPISSGYFEISSENHLPGPERHEYDSGGVVKETCGVFL